MPLRANWNQAYHVSSASYRGRSQAHHTRLSAPHEPAVGPAGPAGPRPSAARSARIAAPPDKESRTPSRMWRRRSALDRAYSEQGAERGAPAAGPGAAPGDSDTQGVERGSVRAGGAGQRGRTGPASAGAGRPRGPGAPISPSGARGGGRPRAPARPHHPPSRPLQDSPVAAAGGPAPDRAVRASESEPGPLTPTH